MAREGSGAHPTPSNRFGVSSCRRTPGEGPPGPSVAVTEGFGTIFFLLLKSIRGTRCLYCPHWAAARAAPCPQGTWGHQLCLCQALARAGRRWHGAWHVGMEFGQPGKVTLSLFSRFPPHCGCRTPLLASLGTHTQRQTGHGPDFPGT